MLMITVETDTATVTFRLDGRLAGPGVRELARNWSAVALNQPHQRVLLDLTGVSSVDDLGEEFLAQVLRHGDRLVGGIMTEGIVEATRAKSVIECRPGDEPGAACDGAR
jgi:anti-anti-sigma regulatory factor